MSIAKRILATILALPLLSSAAYGAGRTTGMSVEAIDRLVARAMTSFEVPGVAVGVVKDGKLVVARGYGVREMEKPGRVDADTLFGIASNTKAFTAAALALLVDDGRLTWDTRVIDVLPEFRLADPWVTREFTVRDLLTHRSGLGLGAGDLMMFPNTDYTRAEIMAGLRHLEPVTSFRSTFAYDNLLYIVAGEVVAAAAGESYETFVGKRILAPLGMSACGFTDAGAPDNIAMPHAVIDSRLQRVARDPATTFAAAGGLECSVHGLAKWLGMHLAAGALPGGKRLMSEAQHREMWTPQTLLPVSSHDTELHRTHFSAYGLGWFLEDYDGFKFVGHDGGLLGMVTVVRMIPELGLGVIVLSNQQSPAVAAISSQILKSYTGGTDRDWVAYVVERVAKKREESAASVASGAAAHPTAAPLDAAQLAAHEGTYVDPWRGVATIRNEGGRLTLTFSRTERMSGPLEPVGTELFVVRWSDRTLEADAYVRFATGFDGAITGFTMRAVSPATDFSFDFQDLNFTRQPQAAAASSTVR
jgi:CubicO group peptidase (beta-lactamase class C family)